MTKTPQEKWKESIQKYRKTCQKILIVSKSIRYAGAINKYGRTLTGIIRPGIKPLLKLEQAKNEFFIVSTLITLRNAQANMVGGLEHVELKHKKVSMIIIPKNKITYYISVNAKTRNMENLISRIKKII